eukprot:sb/3464236/
MNALPREVLKWLQSLDLSISVKNPKWDFSNGYLVAEILSWYHPKEIKIHSYNNGTSIQSKILNWSLLETFFKNKNYSIDKDVIDGTIHCKNAAAEVLVEQLYSTLTNRPTYRLTPRSHSFNDLSYQSKLPLHARATTSTAIKNNLANTELETGPDTNHLMNKTQNIISLHREHRHLQRLQRKVFQDPDRFGIKPTLGEIRAPKRPEETPPTTSGIKSGRRSRPVSANKIPENVKFAEVKVKQSGRDPSAGQLAALKDKLDNDIFGTYHRMNALPREVLKWLQSLDLSISVKNPKWDFSNGYLVAEILSWYHPKEIKIHSYNNGTSIQSKILNWSLLETFFKNKNYSIDKDVIDGTIHCKNAAAEVLVEQLYTTLTNRPTYRLTPRSHSFNDLSYQRKVFQDPDRFGIKPTLGEIRAPKRPEETPPTTSGIKSGRRSRPVSANKIPENVKFAEVKVKQSGRDPSAGQLAALKDKLDNDIFGTYQ